MFKALQKHVLRHQTLTILALFTLIFTGLVASNLINQNLIGDEAVYIVEGDRYLHQPYSYYHNSGSPILLKLLTALPLSVLPLNRTYDPYYNQVFTNVYKVADFTYEQNRSWAHWIIILARLPHLGLAIALGISIFIWAKKIFSLPVALITLGFYTFHATFLAHAGTANLDIGVTAFTFWALTLWYIYLTSPVHSKFRIGSNVKLSSNGLMVLIGIVLGLAQATKISAILLYPFFLLSYFFIKSDKKISRVVTVFTISFFALWALYLFQIGPILTQDDTPAGIESLYGSIPVLKDHKPEITRLLYIPVYPLGAFLNNFSYQFSHSFFGHTNYIEGRFTDQGIWYYIPLAFTIKNSILFVLASILGFSLIIAKQHDERRKYLYLATWILLVILWSMQSKIQLGIRYALPMYPFLFILSGAGLYFWAKQLLKKRYVYAILVGFIITYAISTLRVGNNYFTYISELYRGDNPVDIVFDSDYDWGQNVYRMSAEQKSKNLYPLYFRPYVGGNLRFEGILSEEDPAEAFNQKRNGYYAFSHSALVNTRENNPTLFSYFYSKRPTYIISKTIYVYKVSFPQN